VAARLLETVAAHVEEKGVARLEADPGRGQGSVDVGAVDGSVRPRRAAQCRDVDRDGASRWVFLRPWQLRTRWS
jgi:hypothetical protein